MSTPTVKYAFALPTVGADTDVWGGMLNTNWTKLDSLLSGGAPITGANLVDATITSAHATLTGGSIANMNYSAGNVAALNLRVGNSITEKVQTVSGSGPTITPLFGTIVIWSPVVGTPNHPNVMFDEPGQSLLLMVSVPATFNSPLDFAGVTWINGAPTPEANKTMVLTFWSAGTFTFGTLVGKTT